MLIKDAQNYNNRPFLSGGRYRMKQRCVSEDTECLVQTIGTACFEYLAVYSQAFSLAHCSASNRIS